MSLSRRKFIQTNAAITLGFAVLALIVLSRRLIAPKTSLSESVSPVELFFNRLLFDRDIRDRKAWISQACSTEQPLKQEEEQGEH